MNWCLKNSNTQTHVVGGPIWLSRPCELSLTFHNANHTCQTTTEHPWKILKLKTSLSVKTRRDLVHKYLVHHGLYAATSWIELLLTSEMTQVRSCHGEPPHRLSFLI